MDSDKPAEFVKPDVITETVFERVPEKRKRGRPKSSGFVTAIPNAHATNTVMELEPWEEAFAKWLAEQTTRVSKQDEDSAIRMLVGQDMTQTALRRTKRKLGFIQAYQSARAKVMETRTTLAKHRYQQLLPKAAKAHSKAVDALTRQLDKAAEPTPEGQTPIDVMPILRAAPALLNPFIDRAVPKKTETTTHSTVIHVSLTAEQAKGLDMPVMVVEAEEVQPQIPATT